MPNQARPGDELPRHPPTADDDGCLAEASADETTFRWRASLTDWASKRRRMSWADRGLALLCTGWLASLVLDGRYAVAVPVAVGLVVLVTCGGEPRSASTERDGEAHDGAGADEPRFDWGAVRANLPGKLRRMSWPDRILAVLWTGWLVSLAANGAYFLASTLGLLTLGGALVALEEDARDVDGS